MGTKCSHSASYSATSSRSVVKRKAPGFARTVISASTIVLLVSPLFSMPSAGETAGGISPSVFGFSAAFKSLIQRASRIPVEDDDGKPIPDTELDSLSANKQKIGFSDEDVARALATTGRVFCNDSKGREIDHGSGFLLLPNIMVTAAHGFREKGHAIPGMSRCYFQSFSSRRRLIWLDLKHRAQFFTDDPDKEDGRDLVLVRIAGWTTNVAPFPFDESDRFLAHREKLVALTAYQGERTASGNQPFAQLCTHRNRFRGDGFNLTLDYTDCTAAGGASGGLILARDNIGQWSIREMILWTGKPFLDGQKYNLATGNFTKAITIDSAVMRAARQLARG